MDFLNDINEDTLLIVPSPMKSKILQEISILPTLKNIKIVSFQELKTRIYFDYNLNTILYLMDKFNYKYNVSRVVIDNLYYVTDMIYEKEKLNRLVLIKKELSDNNLLIINPYNKSFFKKKVIVYGYLYINKLDQSILDRFDDVKVIDIKATKKDLSIYKFNNIKDEVEYVFNKIMELVSSGISLNKIKLANIDSKYYYTLKRMASFYNIPLEINNNLLYSVSLTKKYLNYLKSTNSIEESLERLKSEINITDRKTFNIYLELVNISNKFVNLDYSFDKIYECLIEEIKSISIPIHYSESLKLIDINSYYVTDEYIFLMGFNQGIIPKTYNDEDYIEDSMKDGLLLESTSFKNKITKEQIINNCYSINNLIITYSLKCLSTDLYPSSLIKELNMNEYVGESNSLVSYSSTYNKIKLCEYLDDFIKYGTINKDLSLLYSNYSIPYLTYDNKFSGLDKNLVIESLKSHLVMSYTHINTYYQCAFRYYLDNILKLNKYEETFSTKLGTLYHYILSLSYSENFDFDLEYDKYLKDLTLRVDEAFFLIKLKEELRFIISWIRELDKETGLNNTKLEHKIYIDKSSIIPVSFMGIVDKIMYKEKDGNTYISIIDYKTGNSEINLDNTKYGLSLQLPTYLYLVSKSKLFANPLFVGFYLQKILNGEINHSPNTTYLDEKNKLLKLNGYSTSDDYRLSMFDPTYEDSKFIKSMKCTSKGFYAYSKIIDDNEIDSLIDIVDSKIDLARDDILDGNFSINPKEIKGEEVGCKYCKYNDICFKRKEDFVVLDSKVGDNNA